MTKEEARLIVEDYRKSRPVSSERLQTAVSVLSRRRDRRLTLPQLTEAVRAKANLVLIWNLWQAGKAA